MYFRILGTVDIASGDGTCTTLASPIRRAMLVALLLRVGRFIPVDEFAGLLWDKPPTSSAANIRTHITGLRSDLARLEPGLDRRLHTLRGGQGGYRLEAAPDELDLEAFNAASRRGRAALSDRRFDEAIEHFEEGIGLWRGPFGQGLPNTRWFTAHAAGLNNARLDTCQDLFSAYILAGRIEMLSYRIESAIAEAPYRQRLWQLLAAAHYLGGDVASSLSVVDRCRKLFAEDLGIDAPPSVVAIQRAALNWDHAEVLRLVAMDAISYR